MYIDGHLPGEFGETHKISGLPTLLFTATSVIPDVGRCLTLDLKEPGDYIYLIGETRSELGGSEFYELLGYTGLNVPEVDAKDFLKYYHQLEKVIAGRFAGFLPWGLSRGLGDTSGHEGPGRGTGCGSGPGRGSRDAGGGPLFGILRPFSGKRGPGRLCSVSRPSWLGRRSGGWAGCGLTSAMSCSGATGP